MKQIRKNVRAVLALMLSLFACLSGYFFYAVYDNGSRWFTTPYNTRLRAAKGRVTPGDILDRNGVVLATTDESGARVYPVEERMRRAVSHVVGDVDGDVPTGAETFLAADLLGFRAGIAERAARLFSGEVRGADVRLTVDAALQTEIARLFPEAHDGAVALIDYRTGEVLALYSKPEYDAARPEGFDGSREGVRLNRATQGRYAPGSVFKIVTLVCALENLPDVESRVFDCAGSLKVDDEVSLTDSGGAGHGRVTLKEAFAKSCNIAFGSLALELGPDKLRQTAERMGFNGNFLFEDLIVYESRFPKDLQEEGELAWTGVDQGRLTAVPMHLAMIAGAAANGGKMMQPQMVLSVRDSLGGVRDRSAPKVAQECMSEEVAGILNAYMIAAVEEGTASKAAVAGETIAGKTGTAQVNSSGGRYSPHAWYVGYCASQEHPLAIAVVVENGGSGGEVAASLAGEIMRCAIQGAR